MGPDAAPRARAATTTTAAGPLRGRALIVIGFAFLVTITVVIALFIVRPGGNAGVAVAFGGFAGLAAINMIKVGAILMAATAPGRTAGGPALA